MAANEVRPEPDWVVVTLVKGKPGRSKATLGEPDADQGRFSESGRCGDEGEFVAKSYTLIELFD